jgi:hypothetical protein
VIYADLRFQIQAAIQFCKTNYSRTIDSVEVTAGEKRITYDDLWTLFAPGTLAIEDDHLGNPRVSRVRHGNYYDLSEIPGEEPMFRVSLDYVEFDGTNYGWARGDCGIKRFTGALPYSELDICPLYLKNDAAMIKTRILARAKKQMDLLEKPYSLHQYSDYGLVLEKQTDDPILIKFHVSYRKSCPNLMLMV